MTEDSQNSNLDDINRNIINTLQYKFPLTDRPYKDAAKTLGISEADLLARIKALLEDGYLTRFGPLFHAENMGGALSLCAMIIPDVDFDKVTEIVNALPEVAHNYQRDHKMNMWFVLATETLEDKFDSLKTIEKQTGYKVYDMPKEKEFFVGLFLNI